MHKRTFLFHSLFAAGGYCLVCNPLKNLATGSPVLTSDEERTIRTITPEPNTEVLTHQEHDAPHAESNRDFDRDYANDILLREDQLAVFESTLKRLSHVEKSLGHGKFNLVCFDDVLYYAGRISTIGAFTSAELEFIEEIFNTRAIEYGFMGDKVISDLTHSVAERDVLKIAGSGHYLYQGDPARKFTRLRKDVGEELMLTSGIRNISKQLHLFLEKTHATGGNLSRASRSIAPPGYSFHGVGDFDVGKAGFGIRNFTSAFSGTHEFREMMRLGYVDIRYTNRNNLGVRFEPWHIKIG